MHLVPFWILLLHLSIVWILLPSTSSALYSLAVMYSVLLSYGLFWAQFIISLMRNIPFWLAFSSTCTLLVFIRLPQIVTNGTSALMRFTTRPWAAHWAALIPPRLLMLGQASTHSLSHHPPIITYPPPQPTTPWASGCRRMQTVSVVILKSIFRQALSLARANKSISFADVHFF